MSISEKIVNVAKGFIGQKEIKGNQGFQDEAFDKKMRSVGFQTGQAWCSYFAELVWVDAYADKPDFLKFIKKQFSGSSYRTLQNFKQLGMVDQVAEPGSVVIWRKRKSGKYTNFGHVGIVVKATEDHFVSIEGNTNEAGSREGDVVAEKKRSYSWTKTSGLELAGFIHPIEILVVAPELPFKNKTQGNEFRAWVNNEHSDIAKEIDLDRTGSYNNDYIRRAWARLYKEYKSV